MLTKTEVEKLLDQKISKHDLEIYKKMDEAISNNNYKLFNLLASKLEVKDNYVTSEELRLKMDRALTTLDQIYGIVKKMDEEQTVVSHKVQNHENRITKLETCLPAGRAALA